MLLFFLYILFYFISGNNLFVVLVKYNNPVPNKLKNTKITEKNINNWFYYFNSKTIFLNNIFQVNPIQWKTIS